MTPEELAIIKLLLLKYKRSTPTSFDEEIGSIITETEYIEDYLVNKSNAPHK